VIARVSRHVDTSSVLLDGEDRPEPRLFGDPSGVLVRYGIGPLPIPDASTGREEPKTQVIDIAFLDNELPVL
jgi:hypothetical protein